MAGGHQIKNQNVLHFLTFTVVGWIDIFTRDTYREIIIESFEYCKREKGLILYAYVIMSNHIHIIVKTDSEKGLSAVIRDFKKFTAKKIISELNNNKESRRDWMLQLFKHYAKSNKRNAEYQFWKQDNHPIELVSRKWIVQKLDYIHLNPVNGGWVDLTEDYKYSSARNYAGLKGVMEVEFLDVGWSLS